MNNIIKKIEIDLYDQNLYESIRTQQGDNNSRFVEFILYNQGIPYQIPGDVLLKLEGHRGDKTSFIKENCTVIDNMIRVELDSDILHDAGIAEAKIVMYDIASDSILSTIPFRIYVQKNPCDKNRIEKEKKSLIDWLILSFEKLKSSFEEHTKNFSNPHKVTKEQVGLGNVDNTSDMNKPVSTAQQKALDKKVDKTTVATTSTLGLVKSGTDITVDSNGNVSVNDNSHEHTVDNISDLTATAEELNVLDGITASTEELNYTDGVTSNIQTQFNSKAPTASPTLTGIPKAPTASVGTNTTQIATTAFTHTELSNHNSSTTAHDDIRNLITNLTTRLNALADSDDTTLDQLSEIVAYIKSNRTLIENVTTNKVNVSSIVDNLTSTAANQPLSAKQGKVLNDLITELTSALGGKVDKVSGKGLSTNDFTDNYKSTLDNISSGFVTGIKGNAETSYRTGNVNITPANIGTYSSDNIDKNFVKRKSSSTCYNDLADSYQGSSIKPYYRIDLSLSNTSNYFTMLQIELSIGSPYNNYHGKLLIRAYHNRVAEWTNFNCIAIGDGIKNIKVYGSDRKYLYIYGLSGYSNVSIDKMLIGDEARFYDFKDTKIDTVDTLPDVYQTATMEFLSNDYNDLINKPNIPTIPASLPANGGNADTVDGKHASDLQNYNNLTNKPTIPEASYSTITLGNKLKSSGGLGNQYCVKFGNFVFVHLCFQTTQAMTGPINGNDGDGIATLPYIPFRTIENIASVASNGSTISFSVKEGESALRLITSSVASGIKVELNFAYICQN